MRDDRVILFTDGSHCRAGMGAGWLAHDGRRLAYGCAPVAAAAASSTVAEARALDLGVRAALAAFPGARSVDVVSDNDAVVRTVKGWMPPAPAEAGLYARLDGDLRASGVRLAAHWTPGHVDEGTPYGFANAVVDRLARAGARGRRVARGLPYGPGWAAALAGSDRGLHGLPARVGQAVAAAWLGVGAGTVADLVAHGHLRVSAEDGLVAARSVERVRQEAIALGHRAPGPRAWCPGPLVSPAAPPEAVLAVAAWRSGAAAGAGAVIAVGGDERTASAPATARECPVAGAVDVATAMLAALGRGLRPHTPVRVLVGDGRLFRALARVDPPPGRAARLALGRFAATADGLRCRVVIAHVTGRDGRHARMLERAGRLALAAAAGAAPAPAPDAAWPGREPALDGPSRP